MAINPICISCREEIDKLAALLLGPPTPEHMVKKHHLCIKCYNEVIASINAKNVCGTSGCDYNKLGSCTFFLGKAWGCDLVYIPTHCLEYTNPTRKEE